MRHVKTTKDFLAGVRSEMKKVTWTSRRDLIASTTVVIVVTAMVAVVIGVVDKLFSWGLLDSRFGLIPFLIDRTGG